MQRARLLGLGLGLGLGRVQHRHERRDGRRVAQNRGGHWHWRAAMYMIGGFRARAGGQSKSMRDGDDAP